MATPVLPSAVSRPAGTLLLALLAVSLVVQLASMDAGVGVYDEGLALVGAERVLHGDVPYRDFFTLYSPGGFYATAALFQLFGEYAIVERLADAVVKSAIVGTSFLLLLNFGRITVAALGSLLVLALLVHLKNYGVVLFPALALALLAVLALHRAAVQRSRCWAVAAGLAVAATALFRHDIGAYTLLACAAFLADDRWARRSVGARPWSPARAFAVASALPLLPVLAWLGCAVPAADLYRDLVEIPFLVYPRVRALPFPALAEALGKAVQFRSLGLLLPFGVFAPVAVAAWAVVREARAGRLGRRGADLPAALTLFRFLAVLDVLFIAKGLVRVSSLHMGPSLLVSILLLCAGLATLTDRRWRRLGTAIGAAAGLAVLAAPRPERWAGEAWALCQDRSVPRLVCLRLDDDRMAVARYLLAHGGPGQRIYFGLGRHDKILIADQALPFATAALPVTRWHDLHPGVQTTAAVQAEMLAELRSRPLSHVVLDHQWDLAAEPNDSALSSDVTLLDEHLRASFRPVFVAGPVTVLAPIGPAGSP